MGTVLEARHTQLGHRVAIKVLGDELRAQPELVTRFAREARAAGALSSPHAVKIIDVDQTLDGIPYMVMELLDGSDLALVLERTGPAAMGTAVRWVIEACDAIAEAHALGIVHRDIKPSNLFLDRQTGAIKVLDFGIAKRTRSEDAAITADLAPLGTPQYMSPEQARCAKDVDARTDIWSLGVTLFELLCGRPPYDYDIAQACIVAIVMDPVPDPRELRPDLPGDLAAALLRALAKDPDERFQSVEELVLALAPFAEDGAPRETDSLRGIVTARRSPIRGLTTETEPALELRTPKREHRHRLRGVLAAAGIAVALGAGAFVQRSGAAAQHPVAAAGATAPGPAPAAPALERHDAGAVAPAPRATPSAAPSARARANNPVSTRLVHGGISGPGF